MNIKCYLVGNFVCSGYRGFRIIKGRSSSRLRVTLDGKPKRPCGDGHSPGPRPVLWGLRRITRVGPADMCACKLDTFSGTRTSLRVSRIYRLNALVWWLKNVSSFSKRREATRPSGIGDPAKSLPLTGITWRAALSKTRETVSEM